VGVGKEKEAFEGKAVRTGGDFILLCCICSVLFYSDLYEKYTKIVNKN